MMGNVEHMFPINTPKTKEAFLYRMIFEKHFPQVGPAGQAGTHASLGLGLESKV